ncbi:hypothetical protein PSPO01_12420 [Paraphaeosphaeria sporulosa]
MASQSYEFHTDRNNGFDNDYSNSDEFDHRPSGIAASANIYSEPHVFLDLRHYYSSSRQDKVAQTACIRFGHEEKSYSRSSDYISRPAASSSSRTRSDCIFRVPSGDRYDSSYLRNSHNNRSTSRSHEVSSYPPGHDCIYPPSASPSSRSRSDYISPPAKGERHQTSYSTQTYNTYGATGSHEAERASFRDKSDYQMIKEGGRDNKERFLGCHGIGFDELDAFDESRDILDGYRRLDAQAAVQYASDQEHGSDCTHDYGRHRDTDAVISDEDRNTFIRHSGNHKYVINEQDGSPGYRGHRRAQRRCHNSPGNTYDDDQDYSGGSDDHKNACYYEGSINAYCDDQRYPRKSADENGSSYCERSNTGSNVERDAFQGPYEKTDSSDCDSTDAIDYYSESGVEDGEMGGDDFIDDQSSDEYDDDE